MSFFQILFHHGDSFSVLSFAPFSSLQMRLILSLRSLTYVFKV